MIRGIWFRQRKSSASAAARHSTLDRATQPVLEQLEVRQMMSVTDGTERHSFMGVQLPAAPATTVAATGAKAHSNASAATIALRPTLRNQNQYSWGGNQGWSVDQIRHLYGIDTLDAATASAPLYTNTAENQNIAIIGSDPGAVLFRHIDDSGKPTPGNLQLFLAANNQQKVRGGITVDDTLAPTLPGGGGGGGGGGFFFGEGGGPNGANVLLDPEGQDYTQGLAEWTAAIASQANVTVVDIPTNVGVTSNTNLLAGIQQAIADLAPLGGGTCVIPFTTTAEDPTIQAQYDTLFAQGASQGITFVGAAGDSAGVRSMPAVSPYVTSVGGTVIQMDAAGNRNSETAWVRAGGGPSTIEGMPSYQVGVVPRVKGRARRGTPDISIASIGRQTGYGYYVDDTRKGDDKFPWRYAYSTAFSADVMGSIVALADELRYTLREGPIGPDLNKLLYQTFQVAPTFSYTDITLGNNTYQAGIGYDFATGLGVPKADGLIQSLGGVVGSTGVNTSVNAVFINSIGNANAGTPLTTSFTGTGSATFGPFSVGLGFTLTSKFTGATATITIPLFSRNLDGTLQGQGTAHVVIPATNTTTAVTTDLPIFVNGTLGRAHRRYTVTGSFYTIDALGNRVTQGNNQVFQGSFKSV